MASFAGLGLQAGVNPSSLCPPMTPSASASSTSPNNLSRQRLFIVVHKVGGQERLWKAGVLSGLVSLLRHACETLGMRKVCLLPSFLSDHPLACSQPLCLALNAKPAEPRPSAGIHQGCVPTCRSRRLRPALCPPCRA
jgi:hypothetical protein